MLQAAVFDCQFLDLFPFSDDGFVSPEVDIRRCDVAQTFMVTEIHPSSIQRYANLVSAKQSVGYVICSIPEPSVWKTQTKRCGNHLNITIRHYSKAIG